MPILTEPIGSIPRPTSLIEAVRAFQAGKIYAAALEVAYSEALRDTIEGFEKTGSPIITDGEQTKPSFATYPLSGLTNLAPDGVVIPFADGHTRQLPRLTAPPFRYGVHTATYVEAARRYTQLPIKQAVISASALSLIYPSGGIAGYPREHFVSDLVDEAEKDIRGSLNSGAACVQIDFTEARLSLKLDPSGGLLRRFVDLNNQVLDRFSAEDHQRIGVHVCPGGDHDSTHSADVDYAGLLPDLFELNVGRFYLQMASEPNRTRVLQLVSQLLRPIHTIFVGVIDPINRRVETALEVKDRVLEAASILPLQQLGTTDDCGFAPFADDTSTAREIAFSKIRARIEGTELAARVLGADRAVSAPCLTRCCKSETASSTIPTHSLQWQSRLGLGSLVVASSSFSGSDLHSAPNVRLTHSDRIGTDTPASVRRSAPARSSVDDFSRITGQCSLDPGIRERRDWSG
jgi:5-methyltetrahydropteroyltriglutamate--homocysteine methyltransferase